MLTPCAQPHKIAIIPCPTPYWFFINTRWPPHPFSATPKGMTIRTNTLWLILLGLLMLHSASYLVTYASNLKNDEWHSGGDFITFWMRAHQLATAPPSPSAIYDTAPLEAEKSASLIRTPETLPPFPYPPHMLALIAPLGYIDYRPALEIWLLLTLALYTAALLKHPAIIPKRPLLPLILLSPFALYTIVTSQTGFLTAGLLIAGLICLPRKPLCAALCFALLTIKPQLGWLIPILLIAGRQWRCLIATTLFTLIALALTTAWFGPTIWPTYLHYTQAFFEVLDTRPELLSNMNASLTRSLLINAIPAPLAYSLQAAFALFAAHTLWRSVKTIGLTHPLTQCLLITGSFLGAPHILIYDMPIALLPVLYFLNHIWQKTDRPYESLALALLLLSPILALQTSMIPTVFLAMLACHLLLLKRLRHPARTGSGNPSIL